MISAFSRSRTDVSFIISHSLKKVIICMASVKVFSPIPPNTAFVAHFCATKS
nr:MAG TPA: hypothetical protein [Caudoviricetes sp.]